MDKQKKSEQERSEELLEEYRRMLLIGLWN
jgi:hypothetical protein